MKTPRLGYVESDLLVELSPFSLSFLKSISLLNRTKAKYRKIHFVDWNTYSFLQKDRNSNYLLRRFVDLPM